MMGRHSYSGYSPWRVHGFTLVVCQQVAVNPPRPCHSHSQMPAAMGVQRLARRLFDRTLVNMSPFKDAATRLPDCRKKNEFLGFYWEQDLLNELPCILKEYDVPQNSKDSYKVKIATVEGENGTKDIVLPCSSEDGPTMAGMLRKWSSPWCRAKIPKWYIPVSNPKWKTAGQGRWGKKHGDIFGKNANDPEWFADRKIRNSY